MCCWVVLFKGVIVIVGQYDVVFYNYGFDGYFVVGGGFFSFVQCKVYEGFFVIV